MEASWWCWFCLGSRLVVVTVVVLVVVVVVAMVVVVVVLLGDGGRGVGCMLVSITRSWTLEVTGVYASLIGVRWGSDEVSGGGAFAGVGCWWW